jgi:hypothetical protein
MNTEAEESAESHYQATPTEDLQDFMCAAAE